MKDEDRDWIFARRFAIRKMIKRGDSTAADRLPDITDVENGEELSKLKDRIRILESYLSEDVLQRLAIENGWEHEIGNTLLERDE